MREVRSSPNGEFDSVLQIKEGDGAMLEFSADDPLCLQTKAVAVKLQCSI